MFPLFNLLQQRPQPMDEIPRPDYPDKIFKNIDFLNPQGSQPSDNPYEQMNQPEPVQPQAPTLQDALKEVMQRQEGPAMASYRKYLENGYPDEKQFKPGKLTRLGAILSGAATAFQNPSASYGVTKSILRDKFERAKQKYSAEGQRLREGAALEESQYQHKLSGLKMIGEEESRRDTNERLNRNTDSLILDRMNKAKRAGETIQHLEDGHVYVIDKDDPTKRTDLGKVSETPDEKTQRAIKQAVGIASETSSIIEGRQKRVAASNAAVQGNKQKDLAAFNYDLWNKKEDKRQTGRIDLIDERAKKQLERDAAKGPASHANIPSRIIQQNRFNVQAEVDKNPSAYDEIWVDGPNSYKELSSDIPSDPNKLRLRKKIYDLLYANTPATTKSGNQIVR